MNEMREFCKREFHETSKGDNNNWFWSAESTESMDFEMIFTFFFWNGHALRACMEQKFKKKNEGGRLSGNLANVLIKCIHGQ